MFVSPGDRAGRKRISELEIPAGASALQFIEEQNPSGITSVTFSSLGAYTHLKLIATGRGDAVAVTIGALLFFNGDTGNNYDRQQVQGAGGTASASESLAQATAGILAFPAASATAGLSGSGIINIYDYRGTTFQKMVTAEQTFKTSTASGATTARFAALHWRNAAAITSLTITASSGNFIAGTKISLYGIL